MLDFINRNIVHLMAFGLFLVMVMSVMLVLSLTRDPNLFVAPFEFVPDQTGETTPEGWPIYPTDEQTYCIGDEITYSPVARINAVPYVLHPNFTLATAEDDGRYDVCWFDDPQNYPRSITRPFDGDLPLNSIRNSSMCFPQPSAGQYFVEAVINADSSEASAYVAGPFELVDCSQGEN